MTNPGQCLKRDVPLTLDELFLIDQAISDKLQSLAERRMILLDNGKMESYESTVKRTVDHEMLLNKIRRKEQEQDDIPF